MLVGARRTGARLGLVRGAIELTVLLAGFALGGRVGVGTVVFAVLIGPPSRRRSGCSRARHSFPEPSMNLFARIFRLVWGGDVDRALRPVLAVSLIGSIAGSTIFPFLGIWAIKDLHASPTRLGVRPI